MGSCIGATPVIASEYYSAGGKGIITEAFQKGELEGTAFSGTLRGVYGFLTDWFTTSDGSLNISRVTAVSIVGALSISGVAYLVINNNKKNAKILELEQKNDQLEETLGKVLDANQKLEECVDKLAPRAGIEIDNDEEGAPADGEEEAPPVHPAREWSFRENVLNWDYDRIASALWR